jgi:hypothetical protein
MWRQLFLQDASISEPLIIECHRRTKLNYIISWQKVGEPVEVVVGVAGATIAATLPGQRFLLQLLTLH